MTNCVRLAQDRENDSIGIETRSPLAVIGPDVECRTPDLRPRTSTTCATAAATLMIGPGDRLRIVLATIRLQ